MTFETLQAEGHGKAQPCEITWNVQATAGITLEKGRATAAGGKMDGSKIRWVPLKAGLYLKR